LTPAGGQAVSSPEERLEEIDTLSQANRGHRDPELERRLVRLRHLVGLQLLDEAPASPEFASPDFDALPGSNPPEITPADLSPELVRAAILRHGCVLVRGLVDRDEALHLAAEIDRAFETRAELAEGGAAPDGFYEPFTPEPPYRIVERGWVEVAGGVLAMDSPKLLYEMLETFDRARLPELVGGYLGERPAISGQKCTLRKADPEVAGAWHQDGKFLENVRSLNLWLSLSRCGDESPGLDIVPRRIDHVLDAGTEDTIFPIQVPDRLVEEWAGDLGVQRPIFEPGDAMLFDELFLHRTGSDRDMPKPRYAIESWFFGPSAFPNDYVPLAA
jgi:hypothetical protein